MMSPERPGVIMAPFWALWPADVPKRRAGRKKVWKKPSRDEIRRNMGRRIDADRRMPVAMMEVR